jgi:hypothetical protein
MFYYFKTKHVNEINSSSNSIGNVRNNKTNNNNKKRITNN